MDKRLYTSDAYVTHFRPDSERNSFHKIYAEKRDYLLNRIPGENLCVLDLGGGMGRISIPLSGRHRVFLTDLSMGMLKIAGENGEKVKRLNCDAEELCFKNESFDCILVIDLVPHFPNIMQMLDEIRRVLKPGGKLFIDSTNSNPLWVLNYPQYVNPMRRPVRWFRTIMGRGILPEWQGKIHHLSKKRFEHLLNGAGFSVMEWASFGPLWCPKWFLAVCTMRHGRENQQKQE